MTTFVKVSNEQIYNKLERMSKQLNDIENHAIETNGKVKVNRWIAGTSLTIALFISATFIALAINMLGG